VVQASNAPGMLGVGLYTLIMGIVFFTVFPQWLSTDWVLDGALVLAAVLAALGIALLLTSGAILAGRRSRPRARALGLLVGPGLLALGWAAAFLGAHGSIRHVGVSPAILLAALALLLLGGIVVLVGRQRQVVLLPVLLAGSSAAFTIALLLARGPGDRASGAPSLHLYSFPIALVGKALSLGGGRLSLALALGRGVAERRSARRPAGRSPGSTCRIRTRRGSCYPGCPARERRGYRAPAPTVGLPQG
jgi:hypothetical protein